MPFDSRVNLYRKDIKNVAESLLTFVETVKKWETPEAGSPENRGEMIANLMLAFRHLEDASMRFGKALQAFDGGESVYDKETTIGA